MMEKSANPAQSSFEQAAESDELFLNESTEVRDEPVGELVPELLEPEPLGAARVLPPPQDDDPFVERRFLDNGDQRKPIRNTTKSPYNRICQLEITTARGESLIGTGWVIAKRMVITAGHCVWRHEDRNWVKSIRVNFGRFGGQTLDSMTVRRQGNNPFDTTHAYQRSDPQSLSAAKFDYGAIMLPRSINSKVKRMGVSSKYTQRQLERGIFNIFGYPTDKAGGTVLYGTGERLTGVGDRLLRYRLDTEEGQSGSPVFHFVRDSQGKARYRVIGIHNGGSQDGNIAARVESNVGRMLEKWRRLGK